MDLIFPSIVVLPQLGYSLLLRIVTRMMLVVSYYSSRVHTPEHRAVNSAAETFSERYSYVVPGTIL